MTSRSTSRSALALLVVAALLGGLAVSVSYGFALEYGDTGAGRWESVLDGLRWWWFGVAAVAVLACGALRLAWGSGLVRWMAALLVVGTLAGTGAGAAVGVSQKLARYPEAPDCVGEFTSGPAVPVVRAAQAAYDGLDHPGPFSGGGSSGIDGCSSELLVPDGTDPEAAYRRTLAAHGWRPTAGPGTVLRAVKDGQAFELTRSDGTWTVWIGPSALHEMELDEGQVSPRG